MKTDDELSLEDWVALQLQGWKQVPVVRAWNPRTGFVDEHFVAYTYLDDAGCVYLDGTGCAWRWETSDWYLSDEHEGMSLAEAMQEVMEAARSD